MLNALWNTFHNVKLLSNRTPEFVGLRNYAYVLSSPEFWSSMKATVIFTLMSFIPLSIFSFLFGLVMATRKTGVKIMQLVIYSPAILSSVVAALIWLILFDPRGLANSAINFILNTPGIDHRWLTDTTKLYMSTAIIYFWKYIGYFSIIILIFRTIAAFTHSPSLYSMYGQFSDPISNMVRKCFTTRIPRDSTIALISLAINIALYFVLKQAFMILADFALRLPL